MLTKDEIMKEFKELWGDLSESKIYIGMSFSKGRMYLKDWLSEKLDQYKPKIDEEKIYHILIRNLRIIPMSRNSTPLVEVDIVGILESSEAIKEAYDKGELE